MIAASDEHDAKGEWRTEVRNSNELRSNATGIGAVRPLAISMPKVGASLTSIILVMSTCASIVCIHGGSDVQKILEIVRFPASFRVSCKLTAPNVPC
jgi:hypothetical protein